MNTLIRAIVEWSKVDKAKLILYLTAAYGVLSAARDAIGAILTALNQ